MITYIIFVFFCWYKFSIDIQLKGQELNSNNKCDNKKLKKNIGNVSRL